MERSWSLSPTHFKQRKIICHTVLTARITEPSPIQGQWGWDGFLHVFTRQTTHFIVLYLIFFFELLCGKTPPFAQVMLERGNFLTMLCHCSTSSLWASLRWQKEECRTWHTGTLIFGGGSPKGGKLLYYKSPGTTPAQYVLLNCFLSYTKIELKGKEKSTHPVLLSPYQSQAEPQFHAASKSPDLTVLNELPPTQLVTATTFI